MAIVVEMLVPRASRDVADQFDAGVEQAMMRRGGPPAGLLVHYARPEGDGFVLCNVWRSEAEMRSFFEDVILPGLAQRGLEPSQPIVSPVWVFARP